MEEKMNISLDKSVSLRSDIFKKIMGIKAELAPTGGIDTEMNDLDKILDLLKKNLISPEKAWELTSHMIDDRQDYH